MFSLITNLIRSAIAAGQSCLPAGFRQWETLKFPRPPLHPGCIERENIDLSTESKQIRANPMMAVEDGVEPDFGGHERTAGSGRRPRG